jgi:[protein-PII] uridylyltransferase
MTRTASPQFIRAFADSLPGAYRDRFAADAIAAHARVAASRGDRPARVGRFEFPGASGTPVCIVARDRPGLLSTISTALVLQQLDVVAAEAYTRTPLDEPNEAVDLFFLRKVHQDAPGVDLADQDVAALEELISALLLGTANAAELAERQARIDGPSQKPADALVRFLDDSDGGLLTLEVETTDRSGLLMALSKALFEQRVQIVRSEVRTVSGRVFDRFTVVEFDGSGISPARRLDIQVAVLHAIEPARRSSPPSQGVEGHGG